MQDNDWEVDINLGPESMRNIFGRRNMMMYEPDKDLAMACERYQYPQNYLNDDLSSIAGSSVVSSRFSEISLHHNIDEFMFDDPSMPSLSPPRPNEMTIQQPEALPGVVKKLGLRYQDIIEENDDWDDDVQIPTQGISLQLADRKEYEQVIDFDTDIGPSVSERAARSCAPTPPSIPPKFRYEIEQDDDQDDMEGLDFPIDMALLPKRLDDKKKASNTSPAPAAAAPSIKPIIYRSKIPTSPKSKLLASMRERDDEDFTEGLIVKEKNFRMDSFSRSSSSSCLPQQSKPSRGNAPANQTTSRLARPTFASKSRIPELNKRQTSLAQHYQSPSVPQLPTPRRNFLTGSPSSSLHREQENNTPKQRQQQPQQPQQPQQRTFSNRNTITTREPIERQSAHGYTFVSRPKTNKGSYCSQIDHVDNLNDLRPKFSRQVKNSADSQRPWRRNMQQQQQQQQQQSPPPQKKANVRLIKPNDQPINNKYNGMVYDSATQVWKGNENSLLGFQEKTYRRPMLMTQRQAKPSRYAAVVGGSNMIFNAEEQKWVSAFGSNQEFNELDAIEDLVELSPPLQRRIMVNNKPSGEAGVEFKLSVETKRQMMFDQEMHERFIQHWPLQEEPLINRSGHRVGTSKYFLFK